MANLIPLSLLLAMVVVKDKPCFRKEGDKANIVVKGGTFIVMEEEASIALYF